MTLIDRPTTIMLRYGHEPAHYDMDTGQIGTLYNPQTADSLICAFADTANTIGAQVRFGYQWKRGNQTGHCVSVFSQEHPDWIGAFINKLVLHPRLVTVTVLNLLSNFEIKSQEYHAENHELAWDENPTVKLGYRIVFWSLQTSGFLDSDGEEIIDLNDYVDTSEEVLL